MVFLTNCCVAFSIEPRIARLRNPRGFMATFAKAKIAKAKIAKAKFDKATFAEANLVKA